MDRDELPWWAQARARIALLLLILLVGGGTVALAAATLGPAGADDGCWIAEGPPPIWLRAAVVTAAAHRLGLTALPTRSDVVVQGSSTPGDAWSGAPPQPIGSRAAAVPGGYAVTWRSPRGVRVGAAAYRFPTAAAAGAFVSLAASTRCRPGSTARTATTPPGARTLTRGGTGSAGEVDLLFRRGPTGYRLFAAPPPGTPVTPTLRAALSRLACRLSEARCI